MGLFLARGQWWPIQGRKDAARPLRDQTQPALQRTDGCSGFSSQRIRLVVAGALKDYRQNIVWRRAHIQPEQFRILSTFRLDWAPQVRPHFSIDRRRVTG